MTPIIAIVGRPNVGKSTLFNYLTRSRQALVADQAGLTRDRQYGFGEFDGKRFIVIDTGGLEENLDDMQALVAKQTLAAIEEADFIYFVVDGRAGLSPADYFIAHKIRQIAKPLWLVVNKSEGMEGAIVTANFYELGFQTVHAISSAHGTGIDDLLAHTLAKFVAPEQEEEAELEDKAIKVAMIGKPNVGKSTLINRILGEERVLVFDQPGTTRDSIFIPFERRGTQYTLIDTAGVRRRRSVNELIEKFSITKTLQAIEAANVILFVIDAQQGIVDQDLHLLDLVLESGKALVIVLNKWDGLAEDHKKMVKKELDRRLRFINFARIHYISALHGTCVGDLFNSIHEAYRAANKKLQTSKLTAILQQAIESHQPPAVHGRKIKLRYAHVGGYNPPLILIHGNQTDALPDSYKRYLANFFQKALHLMGTPVQLEFKTGDNPYENRKNTLTPRQIKRRQRLIKHVKKKK